MSLEATMLVLDNSQHSLNGDFPPTRLQAQADSVFQIMGAKCRAHPENEVGLMVMAGKGPEVLVTLTQDEGKLVAALHGVKSAGEADLVTGIQVAQLALKHRQNKNQRQRIIVFVGSPVKESQASLVKLGKKLKKNNVALDIVSFGTPDVDLSIPSLPSASSSSSSSSAPASPETNDTKLSALVEATSSSDNSHFLSVEPGPYLLSEKIAQSAILRPEGADEEMGGGGGGGGDEFGVDPNLDPELAMALRMSLEEERARQAAATAATSTSAAAALEPVPEGVSTQITDPTPATEPKGAHLTSAPETTDADVMRSSGPFRGDEEVQMQVGGEGEHAADDAEEDEDLRRALELSRAGEEGGDVEMGGLPGVDDTVDGDEEDDIARAIALSMQDAAEEEGKKDEGK
ncbi:hypothetical protein NBRC10512_005300 [Rhodotorula toruloides]|uniref:26S proteasome regulatory subunit N10 n=1 Tax=Rhodotorula toruloides (strain NP11) TaxID=1130832 RepID=M7XEB5_RHOT1|nr:26S proteasome regulatory subunit N10 [Rhodotorula toruloides NP11]EMS18473.1 26S proteasome regulatory subunit N10 [Rhodotorula toruloides NP11]